MIFSFGGLTNGTSQNPEQGYTAKGQRPEHKVSSALCSLAAQHRENQPKSSREGLCHGLRGWTGRFLHFKHLELCKSMSQLPVDTKIAKMKWKSQWKLPWYHFCWWPPHTWPFRTCHRFSLFYFPSGAQPQTFSVTRSRFLCADEELWSVSAACCEGRSLGRNQAQLWYQAAKSQRNVAGGGERSQEQDRGGKAREGSSGSEQVSTAGLKNLWEHADSQACGFTMSFSCSHHSQFQEIHRFVLTSSQWRLWCVLLPLFSRGNRRGISWWKDLTEVTKFIEAKHCDRSWPFCISLKSFLTGDPIQSVLRVVRLCV